MFSHIIWQMMVQSQGVIFTHQKGNAYVSTPMHREEKFTIIYLSFLSN